MLQLSGEVKDNVFNDFDLVGWIGKYYEAVDGQRVEKRGLTFKSTPEKPFLKDRLHVTPPWMEVRFSDEDYGDLFAAFTSRLDDLEEGQDIGEIPSASPEEMRPSAGVVGPHSGGGALAPVDPKDIPLAQHDKPTLQKMARDLGVEFRQNTIKAELIEAIEKARTAKAESDASPASPAPEVPAAAEPAAETPAATTPVAATRDEDAISEDERPLALAETVEAPAPVDDIATEVGSVDPATGEIRPMSVDEVVNAVGGEVISVTDTVEEPPVPAASPAPVAPPAPPAPTALPATSKGSTCEEPGCGKDLSGENQDYVKLSQIKFRAYLCNQHFMAKKKAS
jgi:hypothetical protein